MAGAFGVNLNQQLACKEIELKKCLTGMISAILVVKKQLYQDISKVHTHYQKRGLDIPIPITMLMLKFDHDMREVKVLDDCDDIPAREDILQHWRIVIRSIAEFQLRVSDAERWYSISGDNFDINGFGYRRDRLPTWGKTLDEVIAECRGIYLEYYNYGSLPDDMKIGAMHDGTLYETKSSNSAFNWGR